MADFEGKQRIKVALGLIGDIVVKESVAELLRQDKRASGELIQSIRTVIEDIFNGVRMTERHIFYGDFVESGRKRGGKKVPIQALEQWIKTKNFGSGINRTSLAFAIQTNIHKFGIEPSKWLTNTVENTRDEIMRILFETTAQNFTNIIKEIASDARRGLRQVA